MPSSHGRQPPRPTGGPRSLLPWLLVAGLAGLAFQNGLTGDFLYDDVHYIVDNPQVQEGGLREAFTQPLLRIPERGLLRPLAMLTWQWQAGGRGAQASPVPFHLLNVALHVGVTLLLVGLCRRVGMARGTAFLAGALYAVHPVHVEAVTWIVGRAELFAALFGLAFLIVATGEDRWRNTLLAAGFWVLACFGKEGAFVLPGVAFLHDLTVRTPRLTWPRLMRRYGSWSVVLVGLILWRWTVLDGRFGPAPEQGPFADATFAERCAITPNLLGSYLGMLVWPWPHRIFHHSTEFLDWRLPSLLLVGLFAVAAVVLRRRPLARWWLWSLPLGLLPFLNLRPIQETLAERFLYLPSLFFCPLASLVLLAPMRLEVRRSGRFGLSLSVPALVLVLGLGATWAGNRHFQSALDLWTHTLRVSPPQIPFPHYQMAYYSHVEGIFLPRDDLRGARLEYAEALRLHEELQRQGRRGMPIDQEMRAHLSLGEILYRQLPAHARDPVEAERHLRRAREIGLAYTGLDWELGKALLELAGLRHVSATIDAREAREHLLLALQLDLDPELKGVLRQELGRVEEELRQER